MCAMMKRFSSEHTDNTPVDRSYFTARDSIELELLQVKDMIEALEREIKDPAKAVLKESNIRELADYKIRYEDLTQRLEEIIKGKCKTNSVINPEIADNSYPQELQLLECELDELEMCMDLSEKIMKNSAPASTQDAIEISRGIPEKIEIVKEKIGTLKNMADREN